MVDLRSETSKEVRCYAVVYPSLVSVKLSYYRAKWGDDFSDAGDRSVKLHSMSYFLQQRIIRCKANEWNEFVSMGSNVNRIIFLDQ